MTTDLTPADTVTVHYSAVELDNGENLRDLSVGDYVEFSETVAGMTPGTWQVVAWRGESRDEATMRPMPTSEILALRKSESEKLAAIFGGNR